MPLSEFEIKRVEKLVGQYIEKRRPEPHIRNELDIAFRISNQSFEIYTIRPQWNDPTKKLESPLAKATYVKSHKIWKLYWMRADLKWHRYTPLSETNSLEKVIETIDKDQYACFWG